MSSSTAPMLPAIGVTVVSERAPQVYMRPRPSITGMHRMSMSRVHENDDTSSAAFAKRSASRYVQLYRSVIESEMRERESA